jgi:hypothetical protein
MGSEQRSKSAAKLDMPGPGAYNPGSAIGKGPKYSMSSKSGQLDMAKGAVSPGPGNYTPKFNVMYKSLSYSMSSRPNSGKVDSVPGPGNYNVRTDRSMKVPTYKY